MEWVDPPTRTLTWQEVYDLQVEMWGPEEGSMLAMHILQRQQLTALGGKSAYDEVKRVPRQKLVLPTLPS